MPFVFFKAKFGELISVFSEVAVTSLWSEIGTKFRKVRTIEAGIKIFHISVLYKYIADFPVRPASRNILDYPF